MKDLGLALSLKYPEATNEPGGDYLVEDHGDGPELTEWNLPDEPPRNQGDVNKIIQDHADRLVDRLARREPDFPTLEERVEALERGENRKPDIDKIKERVRNSGQSNRPDS